MKFIKKVPPIEIKRCFVLSQRFTSKKMRRKEIAAVKKKIDSTTFHRDLHEQKKIVCALSEAALDRIIRAEYALRFKLYNELDWHVALVDVHEVRMWTGAGGLYKSWTEGKTLKETAQLLREEYKKNNSHLTRVRAYGIVQEIMKYKNRMIHDQYVLPIVVPTGSYKKHRAGIRSIPFFLDDGNMRSLAYAVSGEEKIMMYVGMKK